MSKNLLKKNKIRKDYLRRRNIINSEKREIKNKNRKSFSIDFPKSRKTIKSKKNETTSKNT
jgi:hypothetical protein